MRWNGEEKSEFGVDLDVINKNRPTLRDSSCLRRDSTSSTRAELPFASVIFASAVVDDGVS